MAHHLMLLLFIPAVYAHLFNGPPGDVYRCPHLNDPKADLAFKHPENMSPSEDQYPPDNVMALEGQLHIFACCATGFSSIKWYMNDDLISPDDTKFRITDSGQIVYWYNVTGDDLPQVKCVVMKDEDLNMSHIFNTIIDRACIASKPYFTLLPKTQCVRPGDDVSIECGVDFGDVLCTPAMINIIIFKDEEGVFYNDLKHDPQPGDNTDVLITKPSNETAIGTLNFHDITRQQINKKFYCLPFNHRYMKIEYTFETECAHTNDELPGMSDVDVGLSSTTTVALTIGLLLLFIVICSVLGFYYKRILKAIRQKKEAAIPRPQIFHNMPDTDHNRY